MPENSRNVNFKFLCDRSLDRNAECLFNRRPRHQQNAIGGVCAECYAKQTQHASLCRRPIATGEGGELFLRENHVTPPAPRRTGHAAAGS
jgi:hypothetical protein